MKKVFWFVFIASVLLIVFKILTSDNTRTFKEAKREETQYDRLVIDKTKITSTAKFFPVIVEGVTYEVIVVKASDNTIRTAFNACQICSASGQGHYVQEGSFLVCQNCGNRFHIDDIEKERGGCNPSPITGEEKVETNDQIIIEKDTFLNNISLFR